MKKKNLLYIFADQWRRHALGYASEDPVITPNMDAFCKESFVFTQAVSTYPLCSPHRASLLTGKYPTSCGMWTNCKPGLPETLMLKPQEICISDVLKENDYSTAYIGKWHLDASELCFGENPPSGASLWDAFTPPGERRHGFGFWHSYGAMDDHISPHYWENSNKKICLEEWSPTHETHVALDYLNSRDPSKPFCMFLSWNPPHPPYHLLPEELEKTWSERPLTFRENVPEEMRQDREYQKNLRQYFAAAEGLDREFGRIIQYLKDSNLFEDTLVVLSADHGDCMGSHGLYGKNIWYEESIGIPLIMGGGGVLKGESDLLFASPDHAPTLLGFLGFTPPDSMEGRDFSELLRGNAVIDPPKSAFLCMIPGMPAMVYAYRKLGLDNKCFGWRGLRTSEYTYIVDNGTMPGEPQRRWLYHNQKDPFQLEPTQLIQGSLEDTVFEEQLIPYLNRLNDGFLLERNQ